LRFRVLGLGFRAREEAGAAPEFRDQFRLLEEAGAAPEFSEQFRLLEEAGAAPEFSEQFRLFCQRFERCQQLLALHLHVELCEGLERGLVFRV